MIYPHKENILDGTFQNRSITTLPGWSSLMGFQFENLVLNNFIPLCKSLHIPLEDIQKKRAFLPTKNPRSARVSNRPSDPNPRPNALSLRN
ncbi:hypothetical protein NEPTK9_000474 [Candidatus Neptunochlamydia vexilliferae]|uniref:Uncharacterized protein n=1 Tax=Candidatus Neptunichlamydia vexilliferae TaxID=1651774 RepID=A0ABS0AYD0_9BACT|nr:hypothetical protein [Candidatus Neptunochlamydia vexilliferae]